MTKQANATTVEYIMPRVNIIDRPEQVLLEVELPGVPKDGIEIEVKDDELTVIGHRPATDHKGSLHIGERPRGDYKRVFSLSKAVDAAKVDAGMTNGVLTVALQKVERLKPRKIEVK